MVPAGGEPAPERPPHRRWRGWGWWLLGAIVLAGLVGSAFVRLPYYALSPGRATATQDLVEVPDDLRNADEGEVLYLTVSLRRVTPLRALTGWLDPDVEIVPEERILGSRTPSENREYNLELMDISKQVAIYVALEHLGYDVVVDGGGALVQEIDPSVPAAEVLEPGDVIVSAAGEPVVFSEDLREIVVGFAPGDRMVLGIERGDEGERDVEVALADRGDGTPMIGVATVTRTPVGFDFPIDVDIDSGRVGGPSAGLAFALGVLDVLTPGDLTGGGAVAVTGTIDPGGEVGPVGGVAQKAAAARSAGAELMLVPEDEADEARAHAGGLRVEGVETLDEALAALAELGGNALALGQPGAEVPAA